MRAKRFRLHTRAAIWRSPNRDCSQTVLITDSVNDLARRRRSSADKTRRFQIEDSESQRDLAITTAKGIREFIGEWKSETGSSRDGRGFVGKKSKIHAGETRACAHIEKCRGVRLIAAVIHRDLFFFFLRSFLFFPSNHRHHKSRPLTRFVSLPV